jgi:hypothetical protein
MLSPLTLILSLLVMVRDASSSLFLARTCEDCLSPLLSICHFNDEMLTNCSVFMRYLCGLLYLLLICSDRISLRSWPRTVTPRGSIIGSSCSCYCPDVPVTKYVFLSLREYVSLIHKSACTSKSFRTSNDGSPAPGIGDGNTCYLNALLQILWVGPLSSLGPLSSRLFRWHVFLGPTCTPSARVASGN